MAGARVAMAGAVAAVLAVAWLTLGQATGAPAAGGGGGRGVADGNVTPPKVVASAPGGKTFRDTSLPFDQRVADLISRMSLSQKAAQMQDTVYADPLLGIPAVQWWSEAIHGMSRAGTATVFPQALNMAASWDPALMKKVADLIATEARGKFDPGASTYRGIILWAPVVNMAHDPRWGRVEECYGEDPWLTSRLAIAYIQGAQGNDPKYLKTVATPKHFAMYSEETLRQARSWDCPEEVLRDYYFPPFRDSFVEGKAASTMAAFNGINKVPCTANTWLLTEVLRKEWGFEGAVVTDRGGVTHLWRQMGYVNDNEQAVVAALNAGVDVISDTASASGANSLMAQSIIQAVNDHSLSIDVVNRALARNLMLRFRLGMFDPPAMVPYAKIDSSQVGTREGQELALQMARESAVLLQNNAAPAGYGMGKLLPLDLRQIDSIAVLGANANVVQLGAYPGTPAHECPTIVSALRAAVGDRVTVRTEVSGDISYNVKAARESSVVVYVCGLNGTYEKEGADRVSLKLPPEQLTLLSKIVEANPLTIVLVVTGGPVALADVQKLAPAIMVTGYGGEQGSVAAAELLLGKVNPSGKLPITYYRANDDLPALEEYDIRKGRTYMYATKPPTYPFGAGLSYTTFKYDHLKLTPEAGAGDTITATLDVTNTGGMEGDEVVQLYVHEKVPPKGVQRPIKELRAFERVSLKAGETKQVTLTVAASRLSFWDMKAKDYVVEKGVWEVMVGGSSEDVRVRGEARVK